MTMRETDRPTQNMPRERATGDQYRSAPVATETKPSFKSTELWLAIAGVVALIVIYNVASDTSLDLFGACLLCTLLGMAYIVSRGLAKSGSYHASDSWRGGDGRF